MLASPYHMTCLGGLVLRLLTATNVNDHWASGCDISRSSSVRRWLASDIPTFTPLHIPSAHFVLWLRAVTRPV